MRKQDRSKNNRRTHRRARIRATLQGTAARPRLSVFRSLRHVSLQLIDDDAGRTLLAVSDAKLQEKTLRGLDRSRALGRLLAEQAKARGIGTAVFDRSGYRYHGHVRAVAEGAREGGLVF